MEPVVALILTAVGACLLSVVVFFLYREYRIELFRQRIFQIRDELFDYAVEGNLSFDDPAYGALRSSMNSMIRFAHKMSLPKVIGIAVARHLYRSPVLNRIVQERLRPLAELPEGPVREKLGQLHARGLFEVMKFVTFSPLVLPVLPFALLKFLGGTARELYRRLREKGDRIAATVEAQAIESDDQEVAESFGQLQTV